MSKVNENHQENDDCIITKIHQNVENMSNQLCHVIDGDFDMTVTIDTSDEAMQKLCMLINFLLDCARRNVELAENKQHELESSYKEVKSKNVQLEDEIVIRKKVEKELAKLNKEISAMSHRAGMAEVSNSILHNVGNVLNSINTSVELLSKYCNDSKVEKALTLESQINGYGKIEEFFESNDNAEKIVRYFIETLKYESQNRKFKKDEITLLNKNIEHVRSIIQTQQSISKKVSFIEDISIIELINEAFLIVKASYLTHNIELVVDEDIYQQSIPVDRHKMLQIFINLLNNAGDAVKELNKKDKKIEIFTEVKNRKISISFKDNGIGISSENLKSIFKSGFTTKEKGHGFGLHSSANAAREMCGDLHVDSDGVGHGSVFTLILPLDNEKRKSIDGKPSADIPLDNKMGVV